MKIIFFLGILLVAICSMSAQDIIIGDCQDAIFSIEGTVHRSNGNPLAHTKVDLLVSDRLSDTLVVVDSRVTRGNGFYEFTQLCSGFYFVEASRKNTIFLDEQQKIGLFFFLTEVVDFFEE